MFFFGSHFHHYGFENSQQLQDLLLWNFAQAFMNSQRVSLCWPTSHTASLHRNWQGFARVWNVKFLIKGYTQRSPSHKFFLHYIISTPTVMCHLSRFQVHAQRQLLTAWMSGQSYFSVTLFKKVLVEGYIHICWFVSQQNVECTNVCTEPNNLVLLEVCSCLKGVLSSHCHQIVGVFSLII